MALSTVVRGGTVFDGSGAEGVRADVGIEGDRVVLVVPPGDLPDAPDAKVLDADGLAVVPGFVNVLSHAWESLQRDGSGASDLLQGVTTEVFGEAISLGPGNEDLVTMAGALLGAREGDGVRLSFDRLGDGLDHVVARGTAPNVASFLGGGNLRLLGAGFEDRPLTPAELDRVTAVVREEMQDGALGIGSALIYPPGGYASTDELVALCTVVGEYGGTYVSHLRSEGEQFLECLDELLEIGRRAGCRAEVYHLKATGRSNHPKMRIAIDRISAARDAGQLVGANMYPYAAAGTGIAASIPKQYHAGGPEALLARLADPSQRREIAAAVRRHVPGSESPFLDSDAGAGMLFLADLEDGTPTRGKYLTELVDVLGVGDPAEALLEAVSRSPQSHAAYFLVDEANLELGLSQPWVSIGSDGAAHAAVPPFTDVEVHPRLYGSFARFLGRYVRDRGVTTFPDAVRRLTSLPAEELGLVDRGRVAPGSYADVVVLDPGTVADHADWMDAHRYATGVRHVLVNGEPVVVDGSLTGARPGRRLRRG